MEIKDLLNSTSLDDIILGIKIAVDQDLWEDISIIYKSIIKIEESCYDREFVKITTDFNNLIVIHNEKVFEICHSCILSLKRDKIPYYFTFAPKESIVYNDKSIEL